MPPPPPAAFSCPGVAVELKGVPEREEEGQPDTVRRMERLRELEGVREGVSVVEVEWVREEVVEPERVLKGE